MFEAAQDARRRRRRTRSPAVPHRRGGPRVATWHLSRRTAWPRYPPTREEIHVDRFPRALLAGVALTFALTSPAGAAKDPLKVSEDLREDVRVSGIRAHL